AQLGGLAREPAAHLFHGRREGFHLVAVGSNPGERAREVASADAGGGRGEHADRSGEAADDGPDGKSGDRGGAEAEEEERPIPARRGHRDRQHREQDEDRVSADEQGAETNPAHGFDFEARPESIASGRSPTSAPRPQRRLRSPARHSIRLFTTRVTRASSVSSDATANAAEKA